MNGPHKAVSGSSPIVQYTPPAHIAEGSAEWERGRVKLTCRKAYHFVCSAWEDCGSDLWIEAGDQRQAERTIRDEHRWSFLTDLGWTCKACVMIYATGHQKSALGPHLDVRRKHAQALTAKQQRAEVNRKRETSIQDQWQKSAQ